MDHRDTEPNPRPPADAVDALVRGATPTGEVDNARVDALLARLAANRGTAELKQPAPTQPDGLDELPTEQREQSVADLAARAIPSGEELTTLGKLVASLARTSPESLTPEMLARIAASPPGARSFMRRVLDMPQAERAHLLARLPVDARKSLFDELGTDGIDLPLTVALVTSLLGEDPDLASEAVTWGGKTLAQAIVDQLGPGKVETLPAPARLALEGQLREPEART